MTLEDIYADLFQRRMEEEITMQLLGLYPKDIFDIVEERSRSKLFDKR